MAEGKYGKHVISEPFVLSLNNAEYLGKIVRFEGEKDGGGINFTISRAYIKQPFTMIKEAHKHDFDQILIFAGSNSADIYEYETESEFYLGEEKEKHIITCPTIFHIPKGLMHGPLIHLRVDKPVELLDISLAPKYVRK